MQQQVRRSRVEAKQDDRRWRSQTARLMYTLLIAPKLGVKVEQVKFA
ncbi:MAG: hypothetical protein KME42_15505 [Tildeniella nuda ZEHNDER 1965/U140]|nr:hypothetical protein [Tildeniella nuda ZEHNDER 1965/U140]